MRRTERLFRVIQVLRGAGRPVTGQELAAQLEVSLRTLYRDMAELVAQRVPVRGEAGTGYVLDKGYDLPPLMLTPDELEAAVLGASWVAARADPQLAQGARDLVAKLAAVIPEALRPALLDSGLRPISFAARTADGVDIAEVRRAIRDSHTLRITYADAQGATSKREIWPVFLAYMDAVRIVVAWCETRGDYRHFRTDRLRALEPTGRRIPTPRRQLLAGWKAHIAAQGRHPAAPQG